MINKSIIIAMLTIQSPTKPLNEKFVRELKSQDFVLLSQENKQYRQLIKIMQEKEEILTNRLSDLQKVLIKLDNEKQEYKMICNEQSIKISQYESIKYELIREYKILKKQIDARGDDISQKDKQIQQLQKLNDILQESVVSLEQNAKTDSLVIQELRHHISKLQKDLIEKKIKIFSHLVDYTPKEAPPPKSQNQINRSNINIANNQTFKTSANYQSSKNSSNTNSISFSFVSNDSIPRKQSKKGKHNKSIYI